MPHFSRNTVPVSSLISVLSSAMLAALVCAPGLRAQSSIFRNTDPSVAYVGSQSCGTSGCHAEINHSYAPSPHGQSMAPANSPVELARVPKPVTVFNAKNNRYYVVYQQGGDVFQSAYELDKSGRKVYTSTHKIDWVSGGERTGYSYLFHVGDWIFQAPLSFYAPSKTWELSPGYVADDPGFTRLITTGCLVCHNGQPDPVFNRQGQYHDGMYKNPPFRFGELGISCEACHGPGALHVKEMQTKKGRVLGPNEVDTSIVNPAKLSPKLEDDICRNCHQAGDAVVLYPGKNDLDFRPGTALSETLAIVKRPIKPEQRAEADRLETNPPIRGSLEQPLWWKNSTLELSKCYTASHGRVTCSTCHSTHHTPRPEDEKAAYRAACLTCHENTGHEDANHQGTNCTLKPDDPKRVAVGDYCIECHMEKRPVAGIAHSNDTKHRIVRYPGQPLPEIAFEQPKPDLPGLLWMNRPPQAGAQMPEPAMLGAYWTAARKDPSLWPLWFKVLNDLSRTAPDDPQVLNALGAFELAEKKDNAKAAGYFSRSLDLGSEDQSTFLNLATALENQGNTQQAEQVLERGVDTYPYSGALVARLALRYTANGKAWRAENVIRQYRKVFPEDASVRMAEQKIAQSGIPGNGAHAAVAPAAAQAPATTGAR